MSGRTLTLTTYNITAIAFNSIDFRNFDGDILFYDILSSSSTSSIAGGGGGAQTAKSLVTITGTGSSSVPSVRATPGQGLSLALWSVTGRVHFNASMNAILKAPNKTGRDLSHNLVLMTGIVRVQGVLHFAEGVGPGGVLKVGEGEKEGEVEKERIPGGI